MVLHGIGYVSIEVVLDFRTESEEKPKMTLFLTFGSGTSSAQNKNLRPLLYTNIPLISGKYGIRNHFWPLESRFSHADIEEKFKL